MATAQHDDRAAEPPPRPRRLFSALWGLYQQVAAVLAAVGLAALLGNLWHIGWRGFLATIVGVWDTAVRPAADWLAHALVTVPLEWAGVHFAVPLWLRDYLSVGLILALSFLRANFRLRGWRGVASQFSLPGWYSYLLAQRALSFLLRWPPFVVFLWPFVVAMYMWALVMAAWHPRYREMRARRVGLGFALLFSPLIYLGLMLAINLWVMPHVGALNEVRQ